MCTGHTSAQDRTGQDIHPHTGHTRAHDGQHIMGRTKHYGTCCHVPYCMSIFMSCPLFIYEFMTSIYAMSRIHKFLIFIYESIPCPVFIYVMSRIHIYEFHVPYSYISILCPVCIYEFYVPYSYMNFMSHIHIYIYGFYVPYSYIYEFHVPYSYI